MTNVLVLFDISGYIHRAFHSLPPDGFRRSDGLATNSVYGTLNMLLSFLNKLNKDGHIIYPVVCFDTAKSKLNRVSIDPLYKSDRPCAHNELKHQFSWIRELIKSMNIPQYEIETQEADDIIASFALQQYMNFDKVIIVSNDKDLNQLLVQDNIIIYNPGTKKYVTSDDVYDKYKVIPQHFPLYQSLVGDKVDNIQGVKGIGPKIASEVIQKCNGKIENLWTIDHKKSQLLNDNKDSVLTSYSLVKLNTNISINIEFKKFQIKDLKSNISFSKFLEKMEFELMKKRCC